jgi:predicted DNA-binding transcriptional regulator YafY
MDAEKLTARTLWPHALFFSGEWLYCRAFDAKHQAFRDFALHRMDGARHSDELSPFRPEDDRLWGESTEVLVEPDSRLSPTQQLVVARDYGMTKHRSGWVWKETLRQCMIGYFVALHWLDVDLKRPRRTRLALRNRDQVERFFFRAAPNVDG